jgi:hypothetical protein
MEKSTNDGHSDATHNDHHDHANDPITISPASTKVSVDTINGATRMRLGLHGEPVVFEVQYNCVESGKSRLDVLLPVVEKFKSKKGEHAEESVRTVNRLAFSWTKVCHVPRVAGLYIGSDKDATYKSYNAFKSALSLQAIFSSVGLLRGTDKGQTMEELSDPLPLARDVVAHGMPLPAYTPKSHSGGYAGRRVKQRSFFIHSRQNASLNFARPFVSSSNSLCEPTLSGKAIDIFKSDGDGHNHGSHLQRISRATGVLDLDVHLTCSDFSMASGSLGGTSVITVVFPVKSTRASVASSITGLWQTQPSVDVAWSFVKRCAPRRSSDVIIGISNDSWGSMTITSVATVIFLLLGLCGCFYWRRRAKFMRYTRHISEMIQGGILQNPTMQRDRINSVEISSVTRRAANRRRWQAEREQTRNGRDGGLASRVKGLVSEGIEKVRRGIPPPKYERVPNEAGDANENDMSVAADGAAR